uniref:ditrans,polycis-polyprenyl diphosphate synthase [(2E,6E)-farnesyldiphosphate specific] n=1 Tax=Anthurium amnicola TaxID=1678845 RepID=A0A1D1Z0W9_9ARAE
MATVGAVGVSHRLSRAPVRPSMQDLHIKFQRSIIWRLILGICWHVLHVLVSIVHFGSHVFQLLHHFLISRGILQKYKVLPLHKLESLGIVIDSEEAEDTSKVRRLLHWLSDIGVKHVILYDMEGVLKRSEASLRKWTNSSMTFCELDVHTLLLGQEKMSLEILSSSDGKEAVAKAATFLCSKYLKEDNLLGNQREPVFTETDIADALRTVGCGGSEPDLLLVFSPVRCHLGFPAWRLRYTEIVHMGTLKSMKYGAIVKAILDLSKKHQNYGS